MSFHTQFHHVQSVTITKVKSCVTNGEMFWHNAIVVTHLDHRGKLLKQEIELFSDAEDGLDMKDEKE